MRLTSAARTDRPAEVFAAVETRGAVAIATASRIDGRSTGLRSRATAWRQSTARALAIGLALTFAVLLLAAGPAAALKPITLTGDQDWLEITTLGEAHEGRGDALQIETAPAADGATARMAVRATTPGSNPNWIVFGLHNPTNKVIELWLTADRYTPVGSGIVWPDLDARRIAAVAHSAGFAPERVKNDRVDVFRLTVERGQTVTYVAELASDRFSRILLWKPIEFEQRQRERQLFNGIMLGITGLLAVFLTAVFAANHKSIFPMAGLVAWCALGLLCVDFGFWHKLFQMKPEDNAQYRAAGEAALAASLVIFLAAFLRVNLWSAFARTLFLVWIVAQLSIVAVALLDPRLAATVARLSLGLIGVLGFVLILVLSLRGLDRALALMPTWILYLVWLFGAAVTMTGQMTGDMAISGLVSGLVLILVLIGFTVTQYAFRSAEPLLGSGAGGQQLRLAAMDRAGVAFWEWNVRRDEIRLDAEIESTLGLGPGELPTKVDELLAYVHPADRERFRLELLAIREHDGGTLHTGIRLRHADSSYRWLDFEGASVPTSDRRNLRCVGLVRDTTDQKRAQERLLHNAVYDSLTSLPNRELFLDRLAFAMRPPSTGGVRHVTVFVVDVDRFRSVNSSFGLVVGDSIILTVSRRIARILGPDGTLARVGGDQFALYLTDQVDPRELASFAERLRLSLRSPIRIAGQEIVLTGSIGIAIFDGAVQTPRELMGDAEVAMHRAKRLGSDRAEIYSVEMQNERAERAALERDLVTALEQRKVTLLYQPIVSLSNDELIGFEATVRWQHPRLGVISPAEFLPLAEGSDLITRLGSYVVGKAVMDIARWQQELPRPDNPLFVTVGLSSRQLITPDMIQEVRHAKSKSVLPAGTLRFAIPEALVMDNPEQATHVLELLRDAGIELWMDGFGTGYSSLAYLGRFPFDAFKIDKALIAWSSHGERDAAILRSTVAVAHELGRKIVGDGVETPEDAAFLRAIGCHYAQGFHYGEAMGEDEVIRLLRLIRKSERRMRRRGMVRGPDKKKGVETAPADVSPIPVSPQTQPITQPPAYRTGPPPASNPTAHQGNGVTRPGAQKPDASPPPPGALLALPTPARRPAMPDMGQPQTAPARPSTYPNPSQAVPPAARADMTGPPPQQTWSHPPPDARAPPSTERTLPPAPSSQAMPMAQARLPMTAPPAAAAGIPEAVPPSRPMQSVSMRETTSRPTSGNGYDAAQVPMAQRPSTAPVYQTPLPVAPQPVEPPSAQPAPPDRPMPLPHELPPADEDMRAMFPASRRAPVTALSPAVAASLARLAGKGTVDQKPTPDDTQPGNGSGRATGTRNTKAAE